jgi:hypothetical protein
MRFEAPRSSRRCDVGSVVSMQRVSEEGLAPLGWHDHLGDDAPGKAQRGSDQLHRSSPQRIETRVRPAHRLISLIRRNLKPARRRPKRSPALDPGSSASGAASASPRCLGRNVARSSVAFRRLEARDRPDARSGWWYTGPLHADGGRSRGRRPGAGGRGRRRVRRSAHPIDPPMPRLELLSSPNSPGRPLKAPRHSVLRSASTRRTSRNPVE